MGENQLKATKIRTEVDIYKLIPFVYWIEKSDPDRLNDPLVLCWLRAQTVAPAAAGTKANPVSLCLWAMGA